MDSDLVHCEHADECGGCPVLSVGYLDQLHMKRARLVLARDRYAEPQAVEPSLVVPAEPFVGYRTRAKLVVGPDGSVGLYAKGGGHRIVDIPQCRVLSEALSRARKRLADLFQRELREGGPFSPLGETTGAVRAVDLREVVGDPSGILLTFVVDRKRAADMETMRRAAEALMHHEPLFLGIAINFHEGESPQVLGPRTEVLAGAPRTPDRIGMVMHIASYGSFVQAHRGQAQWIQEHIAALLPRQGATVLDLYGGSGAIAFALASRGAKVHLVESFSGATENVVRAAEASQLSVTAEHADVNDALRRLVREGALFDMIVANPPRRGMSPDVRRLLALLAPSVVAYVSCEPETLSRDLSDLLRLGYTPRTLTPVDMIPLTEEVETVAILERTPPPVPRVLCETSDLLFVEKGGHEAVLTSGKDGLLQRLTREPRYAEVVVFRILEAGVSGLVVFAKNRDALARARTRGERPRAVYIAAVRGVPPQKGALQNPSEEKIRFRRLSVFGGHSLVRVVTHHESTKPIRRALPRMGHPVLGDSERGHAPTNRYFEEKYGLDRPFLHCVRIEWEGLVVESPLPGDLSSVLEKAGGSDTVRALSARSALGGFSSLPPPPDTPKEREA